MITITEFLLVSLVSDYNETIIIRAFSLIIIETIKRLGHLNSHMPIFRHLAFD